MKNKQVFIIFGACILLVIMLLILLFMSFRPGQDGSRAITPSGTNPSQIDQSSVVLERVLPKEDSSGQSRYFPGQRVTFIFNKPIALSSVTAHVSPAQNVNILKGSSANEFVIRPMPSWNPDVLYTITIKKGVRSFDGTTLERDTQYKIRTTQVTGI